VCAYYAGMRRGEILNLKSSDIDLQRGFMEVRKTKNDDPRAVPIFEGPMMQWLQWSLEHATPARLFSRPDGRPLTKRNFYADWHAAAGRAGVAGFIPHDSRRSASRNMRNENIPQAVRMRVMGHKTDAMDRRYGIVDLADVELVRERMGFRTTAKTTTAKKKKAG
jgi:integrase